MILKRLLDEILLISILLFGIIPLIDGLYKFIVHGSSEDAFHRVMAGLMFIALSFLLRRGMLPGKRKSRRPGAKDKDSNSC